jgi:hypothetical protein
VGVLVTGTIFALSHAESSDVLKPRLLSKLVEGAVLFYDIVDNGVSSHSETWLLAYETSEVIYFKREHFLEIWNS